MFKRKRLMVAVKAMLLGLLVIGCSGQSSDQELVDGDEINKMSIYPHGGRTKAPDAPDNFDLIGIVGDKGDHVYADWKANYVTSDGAGGYKRVKRDRSTNYDTVSEGIGYGMLLAVYLNDQDTFDNLYLYCKAHFVTYYGNITPLMHWKVDSSGKNVSGFGDYLVDTDTGITVYKDGYKVTVKSNPSAEVPHGKVYGNLSTGKIFVCPVSMSAIYNELVTALDADPNWYQMNKGDSFMSCATDADEDIAAALCFAAKKWGKSLDAYGSLDYLTEARTMLQAIKENDFGSGDGYPNGSSGSGTFIRNGNYWGGKAGWNPSYVTLAYYKYVFAVADDSSRTDFWNGVHTTMLAAMNSIVTWEIKKAGGSAYTPIYFPDWCDTTSGTPAQSFISDRSFYSKGTVDEAKDEDRQYALTVYPMSAKWKDGTSKSDYTMTGNLSFNMYYDAIRVPWRIMLYNSWSGGGSSIVKGLFYSLVKPGMGSIVDGYGVPSGAWDWSKRDVFNAAVGGQWPSTTFMSNAAMVGSICSLSDGKGWWSETINKWEGYNNDNKTWDYFGNTLRMLALVYMDGKMVNLYQPNKVTFKTYDGSHYLCAEYQESDGHLVANRTSASDWETFELIDLGNGKVALRGYYGQFLSAQNQTASAATDRKVLANQTWAREWETFTLEYVDGVENMTERKVYLKAYDGQYLRAENGGGGVVDAGGSMQGGYATFTMKIVAR